MNIFVVDGVTYTGGPDSIGEHELFNKIMGKTQSYAVTSYTETVFHKTTSGDYINSRDVVDVLLQNGYTVAQPITLKVKN